ncbi:AT-rich interactive domain-containing protein 3C isoform X2 [Neofelis nebulosa]|uniref:AT-rich interactive domain-containing protein 3C isoform X2 n=2 Tax=Felidae TaxID=9681 RepID=UPI00272A29A6|nr:AT-rich interactive domain-containing protein 3C isoform X2 [Neofelis nebulosa]
MVLDSSLSFERFLAALQRPLLPFWQCGGGTPVGGLGAAEPRGASPPAPPPALPLSGPAPAAATSRAARERTAARRAHRCGSARQGTPRREQSRGRGCPRGGQSRGNAVETPGAPGRARLAALSSGPRLVPAPPPAGGLRLEAVMEALQRQQAARLAQGVGPLAPQRPLPPPLPPLPGPRTLQAPEGALGEVGTEEEEDAEEDEEGEEAGAEEEAAEESRPGTRGPSSPSSQPPGPHPHEWTYEEQFKQLYELDADPKRKEFLDDLFSFMQKRGTPVNRVPIMAKQVLDLYALFRLVTAKGGLVEVINRKVWREVTRGLSLPTTITSAAFTLRTQYMKYLYPYECETRALSSPGELQAAIDSNRREGRRQAYTAAPLYGLAGPTPRGTPGQVSVPGPAPPTPSPRPAQGSASGLPAHACAQLSPSPIKKEESGIPTPRLALPVGLALGPAREKLAPEEPPEKRAVLMGHMDPPRPGAPPSFLPRGKVPLREERLDGPLNLAGSGISSINMALEINGVVYTGVLFARRQPVPASQGPTNPVPPLPTGPPSSTSP